MQSETEHAEAEGARGGEQLCRSQAGSQVSRRRTRSRVPVKHSQTSNTSPWTCANGFYRNIWQATGLIPHFLAN